MQSEGRTGIFVCNGPNCIQRKNTELQNELLHRVGLLNLSDKIFIGSMRCLHMCEVGPNALILPEGEIMNGVLLEDVDDILGTYAKITRREEKEYGA